MAENRDNGIVSLPTRHSVEECVTRLQSLLHDRGIRLFALIDHSGEAKNVGMEMPDTKLLIFGNPKAGTPLMLAAPEIAIDLPLKILIHQDAAGQVWVSYNAPAYLQQRYSLPDGLVANIAAVAQLAQLAAA